MFECIRIAGRLRLAAAVGVLVLPSIGWAQSIALAPGVRGLATRAPARVVIDGDLAEFKDAFCTPVGHFEPDLHERAAQFLYMWDDEAFYAGLRTLDTKQANPAPDDRLWLGDGVEWYFDTRQGDDQRARTWGPGAIHMYWTSYKNDEIHGRWCLRPDMLQRLPGGGVGIEVAARKIPGGAETELKLPWKNFPDFKPALGAVIALDAELCYGDGGSRTYRTFAYGSPLSVQQPASQARVQLVDTLDDGYIKQVGAVMFPVRCDTPWTQPDRAMVHGYMAIPLGQADRISKVEFRIHGLDGAVLATYAGKIESIDKAGLFRRAFAKWPTNVAVPGAHWLSGAVYGSDGKLLTRVAPRMVSVNMKPGY